jgi:hypothetical protein
MFDERVLAITEDIMFKWRLLVEDGRKAGHTISQPDLIIAATALHHGLTVVTRDVSDYRKARARAESLARPEPTSPRERLLFTPDFCTKNCQQIQRHARLAKILIFAPLRSRKFLPTRNASAKLSILTTPRDTVRSAIYKPCRLFF